MSQKRLPYELDIRVDPKVLEEKIAEVRKEFENKLSDREKEYKEEIGKERTEKDSIKKLLESIKNKQKEGSVYCPTCFESGSGVGGVGETGDGHKHEMKYVGNDTYVCTGPDCGSKKVFVDPESDYECKTCGMPHRRIKDEKIAKDYKCPFCGGAKMGKKDWKEKFGKLKGANLDKAKA